MGFRINTNIAAMDAHRNALMTNQGLDKSLSALSSGLRINKAADDASGMTIADSLRSQAQGLGQAISNANDGVAVVQTADGALNEYIKIINSVRTKAIQAASDGQNKDSRVAIQNDITRLLQEANTIATTTQFNGQKLLDGTFTNKSFHVGAYAGETVNLSVGNVQTDSVGDIKGFTGANTRSNGTTALTHTTDSATGHVLDSGALTINGTDVTASINKLSPLRTTDAAAIAAAITDATGLTADASNTLTSAAAVTSGSINSTNMLKINGIAIADTTVQANDTDGALAKAINDISDQTGVTAKVDTTGKLALTSNDGSNISVTTSSAQSAVAQVDTATFTGTMTAGTIDGTINGAAITQVSATGNHVTDMNTLATNITAGDGGGKVTGAYVAATNTTGLSGAATATTASVWTDGTNTYTSAAAASGDTAAVVGAALASAIDGNADGLYNAAWDAGSSSVVITSTKSGEVVAGTFTMVAGVTAAASSLAADSLTITSQTAGTAFTATLDTSAATGITASTVAATTNNQVAITTAEASKNVTGLTTDNLTNQTGTAVTGLTSSAGGSLTIVAGALIINGNDMAGIYGNSTGGTARTALQTAIQAISGMEDSTINAVTGAIGLVVNNGNDLNIGGTATSTYGFANEGIYNESKAGKVNVYSNAVVKVAGTNNAAFGLSTGTHAPASTNASLNSVDVTNRNSAEVAILIADSALKNLDANRSDLGSVQNQLQSTIRNISVTQVNVTSAESQIRNVDFAQESANFAKLNILAQSGSYAMSQANKIQQNVMRLLQ